MTKQKGVTSVGTTDAMTNGIEAALERVNACKSTSTLVDVFNAATWKSWDAQGENPLVTDLEGLDLSDGNGQDLPKAA